MLKTEQGYFCAVRCTDGREWLDISTISLLAEEAERKAKETDTKLPQWARYNPVVRFAIVEIREIKEA